MAVFLANPVRAFACANPVACENQLPGDPTSNWEVTGAGDPTIQGYATSFSVDVGQTESFKIDTPSTNYHIDILRLGYYGGDGARLVASNIKPSVSLPQTQPSCLTDSSNGLIDCGNWSVSASWTVPSNAVSGVYIAHLVRDDSQDPGGDSQIPFVVRNDASHSDVVVATSDATWEAYNDYGGNSLYTCTVACPPGNPLAYKAAYAVSYNRPFDGAFTTDGGASYLYYAEFQMIYWLEENGYDVSYVSDSDLDRDPGLLLNHKIFISDAHDEYWSKGEYQGVKAALAAGVNLAFFSGNEMFWKTRWANSEDGTNTPYRTLITYKETHFNAPTDPEDPPTWTGAWDDPRFSPPADGGIPANSLTGQQFLVNEGSGDITVPYQYNKLQFWKNTAVANLKSGQTLTLAPGCDTLGYEWDVDADNGFRPPGEFDMSSTTLSGLEDFEDYGSTTTDNNSTSTHSLTLYRSSSGAWVFGAGTVQWAWGLDEFNAWDSSGPPSGCNPDPNMQQATVNLLAMMGAQPTTLMAGLVADAPSTNTTPPTSTITSPSSQSSVQDGSSVTVTGSASAATGSVVAGVEISTDGGSTWHPTTLTTADGQTVNWTYNWTAEGNPSATIETRAVDDSGNLEVPTDSISVAVNCPCSIWGTSVNPATAVPADPLSVDDSGDPQSIELGLKFTSDVFGQVTGIRFYKASDNTGTHVGSLWTASGQLLASGTFTNETSSGWQTMTFSSPVTIMPNTTYVAAYFAPSGHYSYTPDYFYPAPAPTPIGGASVNSPPLHAVQNADGGNGVYTYSSATAFPASTFSAANYWVDVTFVPSPPPGQVPNVSATAGQGSATVTWSAPTTGGPATSYTVTPYIGSSAQTPTTVGSSSSSTTITGLTAGTAYTFTVQATNPNGAGPASAHSNAVTPTPMTPPTAPTGVTASPATGQALVSWTAPNSDGGTPIESYTVTPYIGSSAQAPFVVSNGSATSAIVTGLTNTTDYTFTVAATNAIGSSSASTPSNDVTPNDTIFDFATPQTVDSGDPNGVEVGVRFTASQSGSIAGIRFYKAAANTGTHNVHLWTAGGQLLAGATATNESASGWQTVYFSTPVPITAGATYVASYFAPNGHYSATAQGLASAVTNGPLQALSNANGGNGVYTYAGNASFPTNSYNATNYGVDVVFVPTPPPGQVTNVAATAGKGQATLTWSAPSTGGPATTYTITPYIGSTAQVTTTVTGSPAATNAVVMGLTPGTAYTFTVEASNSNGAGPVSAASNSVTPTATTVPGAPTGVTARPASSQASVSWTPPTDNGGSTITGYTVTPYAGGVAQTPVQTINGSATSAAVTGLTNGTSYTFTVSATNSVGTGPASAASSATTPEDTIFDFATPGTQDSGDGSSLTLGVAFKATKAGSVTGVRFYKAAANTGTHIGSLWTAGGSLLASAAFTSETTSGWQSVTFASPVPVVPGQTYVASYYAPNGHYSADAGGLSSAVSNGPLQAPGASATPNGLYAYGSGNTFPASSYNATNYYVDVMFAPDSTATAPSAPTSVTASPATNSALVSWTAPTSDGGSPLTGYTITPYIGSAAQTPIQVTNPSASSTTVTGLTNGTSYTFQVVANNGVGASPAGTSNAATPEDTIFDFGTPSTVDSGDTGGVTLGVTFTASESGSVTGIRFYKAADNTGTHVGALWDSKGDLLASANFTNESASGWQTVTFTNPVAITANQTYVASVYDPDGHYSTTSDGFGSAITNGPLQALASSTTPNGVYTYGNSSVFPTSSYNSTNYWVDVLFSGS